MVKLYSNENFPMNVVMELRRLGYDVLSSYDAGQANQGIPDQDVLTFATQQKPCGNVSRSLDSREKAEPA